MKDLHNNIKIVSSLDPIAAPATATYTIDLVNWNSAEIVIALGVDAGLSGSNYLVFTLQDSADNSTYANVETADMLGVTVTSAIILTINSTTLDNLVYNFGYVGGQRYLQLTCTKTGTVTMPMAILVVKSHALDTPNI